MLINEGNVESLWKVRPSPRWGDAVYGKMKTASS